MCGIALLLAAASNPCAKTWADAWQAALEPALRRRGPDSFAAVDTPLHGPAAGGASPSVGGSSGSVPRVLASVLSMQGDAVQPQPMVLGGEDRSSAAADQEHNPVNTTDGHIDSPQLVLAMNGEIFAAPDSSSFVGGSVADSRTLALLLRAAMAEALTAAKADAEVSLCHDRVVAAWRNVLESLSGPFALVIVVPQLSLCVCARDPLGRRSLVVSTAADGTIVSSIGVVPANNNNNNSGGWSELPITGLFRVDSTAEVRLAASWQYRHVEHPLCRPHPAPPHEASLHPSTRVGVPGSNGPVMPQEHVMPLANERGQFPTIAEAAGDLFRQLAVASVPPPASPLVAEELGHRLAHHITAHSSGELAADPALNSDPSATAEYLASFAVSVWRRSRPETRGPSSHSGSERSDAVVVLFSGGIDSTVVAAMAHVVLEPHVTIELVNVAFGDAAEAPDRQTCLASYAELRRIAPDRRWALVFTDVDGQELEQEQPRILRCVLPCASVMDQNIGSALWFATRGVGVRVPDAAAAEAARIESGVVRIGVLTASTEGSQGQKRSTSEQPGAELVAALVQDGICTRTGKLLADLGKEFAEPVESFLRDTGCRRLKEALESSQGRSVFRVVKEWPFERPADQAESLPREAAGVDLKNSQEEASRGPTQTTTEPVCSANPRVMGAKAPRGPPIHRVMLVRPGDIEAANAVRHAREAVAPLARAATCGGEANYRCRGRVVLMGMGADESLGGYVRHAKMYARGGEAALKLELSRDFERLWQRNLGRDDRVSADHGREGRFPFLDETVLATVSRMPMTQVVDLTRPAGVGDKMLLRSCARQLGLQRCSAFVKRAVQFGTRIADRKLRGETSMAATTAANGSDHPMAAVNPKLRRAN